MDKEKIYEIYCNVWNHFMENVDRILPNATDADIRLYCTAIADFYTEMQKHF